MSFVRVSDKAVRWAAGPDKQISRSRGLASGTRVALVCRVLSIAHEAPLEVLRKVPELVPALLRESLGLELPSFTAASRTDSDFTQARPAPFRADLAITLHDSGPGRGR